MSIKVYFKSKERHTQGLFGAIVIIDHSSLKICSPATFRRLLLITYKKLSATLLKYFLAFTNAQSFLPCRAMSSCTTAYPTSIRTTDAMWSPGMTANWMVTGLLWRYNHGTTLITCRYLNECFLHQFDTVCFLQNPSKECEPYRTSDGQPIAPCGAIANSLFNGKWDMVNNFAFFSSAT